MPGEVVEVAGGSYLGETIAVDPAKTSMDDVVFRAAAGADVQVLGQLQVDAKHIEFADMFIGAVRSTGGADLTFRNVHVLTASFVQGARDIRYIGGEVGPNAGTGAGDGMFFGSTAGQISNVLIDGVTFHDVTRPTLDAHSDCLQFTRGENVTIRRSKFLNCYDANIFVNDAQGPHRRWTVENNFFGASTNGYYGLQIYGTTSNPCENFLVRNNSLLENMYVHCPPAGVWGLRVLGNIQPSMASHLCTNGTAGTWLYNVYEQGEACPRDRGLVVSDGDVGYVDRALTDLHLQAGSEAIDWYRGPSYPGVDFDGAARPAGEASDAGAHEAG